MGICIGKQKGNWILSDPTRPATCVEVRIDHDVFDAVLVLAGKSSKDRKKTVHVIELIRTKPKIVEKDKLKFTIVLPGCLLISKSSVNDRKSLTHSIEQPRQLTKMSRPPSSPHTRYIWMA